MQGVLDEESESIIDKVSNPQRRTEAVTM